MRVSFQLTAENECHLSYQSGVLLGSSVYARLRKIDKEFAEKLHDEYTLKPYAISNIRIPKPHRRPEKEGLKILPGTPAYFYISSMHNEIMHKTIMAVMKEPTLNIRDCKFTLTGAKILQEYPDDIERAVFHTITPAVFQLGKHYADTKDKNFLLAVEDTTRLKIEHFGGKLDELSIISLKRRFYNYKGAWIPVFDMVFEVAGKRAPQIIYNYGIGHKNAFGFGYVKAGRKENAVPRKEQR